MTTWLDEQPGDAKSGDAAMNRVWDLHDRAATAFGGWLIRLVWFALGVALVYGFGDVR